MTSSITMFGALSVRVGDRTLGPKDFAGRKPKQLLEILLVNDGRPVPKDQLAERLWADAFPVNFMASLEHYVSLLRKRLNPGGATSGSMVRTVHGGYAFNGAGVEIDVATFDTVYARNVAGTVERRELERACDLVQGELLEDEPYADWVIEPRAHYAQRAIELLTAAAATALADHDGRRAVELAATAVARDSFAEPAHRLLMLGHYSLGRQRDALAAYDRCRKELAGELGLEPLPQTAALHAAILDHRSVEDVLRDFVPEEARRTAARSGSSTVVRLPDLTNQTIPFVGREHELDVVAHAYAERSRAAQPPVIVLEGGLGSGKSRFLDEVSGRFGDARVVRLSGTLAESWLPGSGLAHLLSALCAGDPRLPDMLAGLPAALDQVSSRGALYHDLLAMVSDAEPFVVLWDDAHLVDDVSVQIMSCLIRRLRPSVGVVVLAFQGGLLSASHPVGTLPGVIRLSLSPLAAESLAIFGIGSLHASTGGLAMFVADELARRRSRPGGPAEAQGNLDRFRRLLGEQLFRTAATAAALDDVVLPEPLARVLGSDPVRVAEDLERLAELRIVRVVGGGFSFQDETTATLLGSTVSPARRRLLQSLTRSGERIDRRSRRGGGRASGLPSDRRNGTNDRRLPTARKPVLIHAASAS